MTVLAKQPLDWQLDWPGFVVGIKRRRQGGAYLRMFQAPSERYGEGAGICDSGRGLPALVPRLILPEAVDSGGAFGWIELGGVFQVRDPSLVHLLGDPAFVADVGVTAALVEGGEDALHLGRAAPGGGQPWAFAVVGLDVAHRVPGADVRQAGPPGLEPADRFERVIWPFLTTGALLPARDDSLLQVGGVLGSAARLNLGLEGSGVAIGGRAAPTAPPGSVALIGLVRTVPELVHATSITG